MDRTLIKPYLANFTLPQPQSHKGQNGKVLLIGGSDLFHAASKWSLDVVSKLVDMVFYASVPANNELIKQAKGEFWNGIVIEQSDVETYLLEADVILIGPGMTRTPDTEQIVNELLAAYPHKKWVIDAGALQMVDPSLLNANCIITPHKQEFKAIYRKRIKQLAQLQPDGSLEVSFGGESFSSQSNWAESDSLWFEDSLFAGMKDYDHLPPQRKDDFESYLKHASKLLGGATILIKGPDDFVTTWTGSYETSSVSVISGGNAGMTKGGTGDVLAGLVAGIYATHDAPTAAVVASYCNKAAGESLYQRVGPYFNASDLATEVPIVLWREVSALQTATGT